MAFCRCLYPLLQLSGETWFSIRASGFYLIHVHLSHPRTGKGFLSSRYSSCPSSWWPGLLLRPESDEVRRIMDTGVQSACWDQRQLGAFSTEDLLGETALCFPAEELSEGTTVLGFPCGPRTQWGVASSFPCRTYSRWWWLLWVWLIIQI